MDRGQVMDFAEKLKRARRPERSVPICLRLDLLADFEALDRRLEQLRAEAPGSQSLAGGEKLELAQQMESLREQMQEASEDFRLRALDRGGFGKLKREHPAREDDEREVELGFSPEPFFNDLIRKSVTSPEMTDDQWTELFEVLDDGQYALLANTAMDLNQKAYSVPFSSAASQTIRLSDEELRQQNGSESASPDSTGGSLAG